MTGEFTLQVPPSLEVRLRAARSAVVLTGAGISAESGLGTFRGPGGLWEKFRPEELATPRRPAARPAVVWEWYCERWRVMREVAANPGHAAISRWPALFSSFLLVTQNIDGLHQRAGSPEVLELHGSLSRARCEFCEARLPMDEAMARSGSPPLCACGGRLRPDVVWFGEMLPPGAFDRAAESAEVSDMLVTVGTSATVYPAAGLIEIARRSGALVIEVNPEPSALADLALWQIAAPASRALPALTEWFEKRHGAPDP
jgi:NAD-dependent deacetylase